MKPKLIFGMFVALVLSACERKTAAIQTELTLIEKTAQDTSQTEYVRESSKTFTDILLEKQEFPDTKLRRAQWEMSRSRNATTISTYVAFLKAVEKQLPNKLPSVATYEAMKAKIGKAKIVEYNVAQTVFMLSNSIRNISLYGDPVADAEVEGVLQRLKEKHGTSETGKKILERLNIEREQGLGDRARGTKPWDSPRKPIGYID